MVSAGDQVDQEFLPFAVELGGKDADPGCVALGVGHRAHQTGADHVVGKPEDWNRRGRLLGGTNCRISAARMTSTRASTSSTATSGNWPARSPYPRGTTVRFWPSTKPCRRSSSNRATLGA